MGICGSKSSPSKPEARKVMDIEQALRMSDYDLENTKRAEEARLVLSQYIASNPRNAEKLKRAEGKLKNIKVNLAKSNVSQDISPKVVYAHGRRHLRILIKITSISLANLTLLQADSKHFN